MYEHETKIELAGVDMPALIEYEIDGKGADGILIYSVLLRRCVYQRGDISFDKWGVAHKVTFPEYISTEIFRFLNGQQLKALAEEISSDLAERSWNEAMSESNQHRINYNPDYRGKTA